MPDVNRGNRPLSPFMLGKHYRIQMTSLTSILNRITGNAMLVGAILVVWWLIAAATGPEAFATADAIVTSWLGDLVMFLSLLALWYHALAGLRHLIWDTGHMLEVRASERFGVAMMVAAVLLTILTVIVI